SPPRAPWTRRLARGRSARERHRRGRAHPHRTRRAPPPAGSPPRASPRSARGGPRRRGHARPPRPRSARRGPRPSRAVEPGRRSWATWLAVTRVSVADGEAYLFIVEVNAEFQFSPQCFDIVTKRR